VDIMSVVELLDFAKEIRLANRFIKFLMSEKDARLLKSELIKTRLPGQVDEGKLHHGLLTSFAAFSFILTYREESSREPTCTIAR
jgi:hypothetical protein